MTRALYRVSDGALLPYPRQDDEPVLGLNHQILRVVVIVQEPQPVPGDGQVLEATEAYEWFTETDAAGVDGVLTRGWRETPAPPPPVIPDWPGFAAWLYTFPAMMAAIDAARLSTDPQGEPAATSLPTLLVEARDRQNYPAFALSWGLFLQASNMAAGDLGQIVAKAQACNLPGEFLAALQPEVQP